MKGVVKWFDVKKGYGFITGEDGKDIFVHYSGILAPGTSYRELSEGQEVSYSVEQTDKGPMAVCVLKREGFSL
mgnify:CR=1 FL=1